jgi:hypothetical protein
MRIVDRLDANNVEMMEVKAPDPMTGGIINDLTIGEYSVTVQDVPARANYNDIQFVEAIAMREAGVMIPDHIIVQYSNLENKDELVETIKRMTGMAEPTEEEMQAQQAQAEIGMQMQQLQLAEMQAKVQNLMSQAQLNAAKAEDLEFDADNFQLEVMRIQAELAKAQATLDNKTQIAKVQAEAGRLREHQGQVGRFNQTRSAQSPGGRNN